MKPIVDFDRHNEDVRRLWAGYRDGRPSRVPVVFGINPRVILLDPALNSEGVTFERYSTDPQVMLDVQLRCRDYVRHNIPQDAEMGLPDAWDVAIDFQNYFEAGFLGAPVHFPGGNVPVARPLLAGDSKHLFLDRGPIDPADSSLFARNADFHGYMARRRDEGFEYRGRPLGAIRPAGGSTDGPMTNLITLRGDEALLDMYLDPAYFSDMMDYLTEAGIAFARASRRLAGLPERRAGGDIADDSIELLSVDDYRRFVLPWHRRLFEKLGGPGPRSIHICGDVQRHFPALTSELSVSSIDTGFPIRWETLRDEIGDDVEIYGGPHIEALRRGTVREVASDVRRILGSGITRGRRFVLREGNNLPPMTPLENLHAMYDAAREFGTYD